jgi:hypothetical protein
MLKNELCPLSETLRDRIEALGYTVSIDFDERLRLWHCAAEHDVTGARYTAVGQADADALADLAEAIGLIDEGGEVDWKPV